MKVNIFEAAKPQNGEFFKFKAIGDGVQGTYIDQRNGTDSYGNQQTIYVLDDNGKIWNLGFRDSAVIIHERMKGIKLGQIVGFKYDEDRASKVKPGTTAKIIRVYAAPNHVDEAWLANQASISGKTSQSAPEKLPGDDFDNDMEVVASVTEDLPFKAPVAAQGTPSESAGNPKNEALDAIRTLARTKGLTSDAMTSEGADATIEQYTGHKLEEANLTKIIIALTGYISK